METQMAGILVPILKKTRYDYTFLTSAGAQSVVLHRALNVVPYKFGRLLVRVHRVTMVSTAQNIAFDCFGTDPSDEDPQEFDQCSFTDLVGRHGGYYGFRWGSAD
jgi:hypothetical protein